MNRPHRHSPCCQGRGQRADHLDHSSQESGRQDGAEIRIQLRDKGFASPAKVLSADPGPTPGKSDENVTPAT